MSRCVTRWSLLALLLSGCGGVTPVARSERAVVGWGLGLDYCMEPINSADQTSGQMVLGYPEKGSTPAYGVGLEGSPTRGREIAEIMLFARESLYRVCEARQNDEMDQAQAAALRASVVQLIEKLIQMRNAHDVVALKAKLVGDIAALDAQRAPPCAAGDAPCRDRQAEIAKRLALYEDLLKRL